MMRRPLLSVAAPSCLTRRPMGLAPANCWGATLSAPASFAAGSLNTFTTHRRFAHTSTVGANDALKACLAAAKAGAQSKGEKTATATATHSDGATYIRPPTSIKDVQLHLPPHRYSFFSDDYRMPHLTYETSRLEDEAGVVAVDTKSVLQTDDDQAASPAAEASSQATTFCNVYKKHRAPADLTDRLARGLVTFARSTYDYVTGYAKYNHDLRGVAFPAAEGAPSQIRNADGSQCPLASADLWLQRAIFLETVAAVPGMVAAMVRHLRSLRILKKDDGWIHSLLEEAENERMHLFFFLKEKEPSIPFRMAIAGAQGTFWLFNFFGYLISPRFMHRFVGYIEEEAVHTYSIILRDIDRGLTPADDRNTASNLPANHISHWRTKPAPKDYIRYYDLHPTATYRDVVLCIRADELSHREHNHMYADAHALKAQADVGRILKETQPLNVVPAHQQ